MLNGRLEELAYERGTIDTSLPLPRLIRLSDITQKAKSITSDADFSNRIREGLPGFAGPETVPTSKVKR